MNSEQIDRLTRDVNDAILQDVSRNIVTDQLIYFAGLAFSCQMTTEEARIGMLRVLAGERSHLRNVGQQAYEFARQLLLDVMSKAPEGLSGRNAVDWLAMSVADEVARIIRNRHPEWTVDLTDMRP